MGNVHMNKGRAGEDRGSKETDGCPLTGPWRWYRGVGEVHMNKGRVGEERGGKETDRCPLTLITLLDTDIVVSPVYVKFGEVVH
jgi:hypothetical protein